MIFLISNSLFSYQLETQKKLVETDSETFVKKSNVAYSLPHLLTLSLSLSLSPVSISLSLSPPLSHSAPPPRALPLFSKSLHSKCLRFSRRPKSDPTGSLCKVESDRAGAGYLTYFLIFFNNEN